MPERLACTTAEHYTNTLTFTFFYVCQTRDQQRFTILEVAVDWHEPVVAHHIMWLSIVSTNRLVDSRCS